MEHRLIVFDRHWDYLYMVNIFFARLIFHFDAIISNRTHVHIRTHTHTHTHTQIYIDRYIGYS